MFWVFNLQLIYILNLGKIEKILGISGGKLGAIWGKSNKGSRDFIGDFFGPGGTGSHVACGRVKVVGLLVCVCVLVHGVTLNCVFSNNGRLCDPKLQ